jgi:CMP-N-acetylneuraminic acid synthetase
MKVAALIPCRKGSKGIPNKNFRELKGKPLWEWTHEAAVKSKLFDKIILSSDGGFTNSEGDTLKPNNDYTVVDNVRPDEFSTDEANLDNLLCYYANGYPDVLIWCLLQPTSPLRTHKDIQNAYKMVSKAKYDSVVSVTPGTCMYWVKDAVEVQGKPQSIALYHYHLRPNRQERLGKWFQENGAIYFTKRYVFESSGVRLGGNIGLYSMPKERSFEIDDEVDWKICEMMVK